MRLLGWGDGLVAITARPGPGDLRRIICTGMPASSACYVDKKAREAMPAGG
jgi:hypothetical protein